MNDKAMTVRSNGSDGGGSDDGPIEAHLWVCSGKNVGRRYRVDDAARVLGRALDCDIVVEDERASQRHARLLVAEGAHVIEDLGSTNGTFVNNQRIERVPLRDGDLLQVGETIYEYLSHEERTLSTTSRGTQPESEAVPDTLRSGAQQMLRRVRRDQVEPAPAAHPVPAPPGAPAHPAPPGYPGPGHPAYPPYPQYPPYAGHYNAYYDDEDDEDDEPKKKDDGGFDLIGTIVRVKTIAGLYKPYWPMAVAFAFVGVMLGALHFKLNPPGKTANFQIVLNTAGTSANVIGSGGFDSSDKLAFFENQVAERFLSPPIIEAAYERLKGNKPSGEDVADLKEQLDFYKMGQFRSNQYGGSMKASTGDFAVRYLNTHLDIWLEREIEMGLSQVKADVRFFKNEVENAARELEAAEQELSKYKAAHPDALPDQAKSNYNLLFSLQQKQSNLQTSIAALEATISQNRRSLSRTSKLHTTGVTQSNPYQQQIATVNSNIAAARAAGKGDEHPDLKRLQAQLTELEQLARDQKLNKPQAQVALNTSYQMLEQQVQQDTAKLRALKEELRETDEDLEIQRSKIKELPKAEAEFQNLAQDYETAQQAYGALLRKLKNAQLQLERERSRADAQYSIVVPPRVAHKPIGNVRKLRLALGGIAGLFLSFVVASILLIRSGRLTLSLLLGREIDLSALRGEAPAGPALGAGEAPSRDLPERAPTATLPASAGSEPTDVLERRKRS